MLLRCLLTVDFLFVVVANRLANAEMGDETENPTSNSSGHAASKERLLFQVSAVLDEGSIGTDVQTSFGRQRWTSWFAGKRECSAYVRLLLPQACAKQMP